MKTELRETLPGHICCLTCNIMWGLMSPVSKEALNYFAETGVNPVVLPTFRVVGATVCFWILSLFVKSERIERQDWGMLALAGLLSIAFNQNLFVCGIAFTSPVDASVMTTMLPIVTMILSAIVLKEPISKMKAGGVALGLTGALLLILSEGRGLTLDGRHALGDIMCLSAQVSFALYLVFCSRIMKKYSSATLMKWMFLISSVVVLPFTASSVAEVDFVNMPIAVYGEILYVIVGGTFVTFLMVPTAQKRLRPTVISSYNYAQPVVATTVSLIIGVATFGWVKGMAVALVFTGVLLVTKSRKRV